MKRCFSFFQGQFPIYNLLTCLLLLWTVSLNTGCEIRFGGSDSDEVVESPPEDRAVDIGPDTSADGTVADTTEPEPVAPPADPAPPAPPAPPLVLTPVTVVSATIPTIHYPCTKREVGIWASPRGVDAEANGSFERPFRSVSLAVQQGRMGRSEVCVETGEYDLGSDSLQLTEGDRVYGSNYVDASGNLARTDLPSTKLFNDGARPVVQFFHTMDHYTYLEGFHIKNSTASTLFTQQPLVWVTGGTPILKKNLIETRVIPAEAAETYQSVAIKLETRDANIEEAYLEGNFIRVHEVQTHLGSGIGVLLATENSIGNIQAILKGNNISVDRTGYFNAGILGYSRERTGNLSVTIEKNTIHCQNTSLLAGSRQRDGIWESRPGGYSLGVGLGVNYSRDGEALQSFHLRGYAVLQGGYFSNALISQNKISGDADNLSNSSIAIHLGAASDRFEGSMVSNNFIRSGMGKTLSTAIHVAFPNLKVFHNTFRLGQVESSSIRESSDGCPPWPLACGSGARYNTGAMAAGISIATISAPRLEIINNIFSADDGNGESTALYFHQHKAMVSKIQNNLWATDNALISGTQMSMQRLHLGQLASAYSSLENPTGFPVTITGNLASSANFVAPDALDFHLADEDSFANNNGLCLPETRDDIDGETRAELDACDIGADEV